MSHKSLHIQAKIMKIHIKLEIHTQHLKPSVDNENLETENQLTNNELQNREEINLQTNVSPLIQSNKQNIGPDIGENLGMPTAIRVILTLSIIKGWHSQ
jgi:hypothetical protein